MLYLELPRIDATPLDGWGRWLAPALAAAAGLTAAAVLLLVGDPLFAGIALLAGLFGVAFMLRSSTATPHISAPLVSRPDYSLVGSALGLSGDPVALTDGQG